MLTEKKIYSAGAGRPEVYLYKHEGHDNEVKKEIADWDVYKSIEGIYNVSLSSNLKCFPQISYQQFFDKIGV